MALKLLTPPALPCVSLAEAKAHCRVDTLGTEEDALLTSLVAAATQDAEHLMQRAIMPQQWLLTLDAFPPDCIELRRPPVTAVDAVRYAAADTGALTTLTAGADYQVDLADEYTARVAPAYGKGWPAARVHLGAVQVQFTCGWASAAAVPAVVRQWILLRVGAFYENREAWTLGKPIERNQFIDGLLDRYRVFTV